MKKYSGGWTFLIFILGLVFLGSGGQEIGALLLSWAVYRLGYNDGAKDGRRSVFTK